MRIGECLKEKLRILLEFHSSLKPYAGAFAMLHREDFRASIGILQHKYFIVD